MKNYQTILKNELLVRQRKNSQFSMRAFAKILGMSPGQLSSLMSGKKTLSIKQAGRIIVSLKLDEDDSVSLLRDLMPASNPTFAEVKTLSDDEFALISNWVHYAVLGLAHIKENRADAEWIAERLEIDLELAVETFNRLKKLRLIQVRGTSFVQTSRPLTTTSDIPSHAIREHHRQNLILAMDKLQAVPVDKREYSSMTMTIDPAKIPQAKKMIKEFRNKLSSALEKGSQTEVYTISMQLFPLTSQKGNL